LSTELHGPLADTLSGSSVPVLIDFWAKWCGPCKVMLPHLTALEAEFSGRLTVVKVDVDEHRDLLSEYGVHSVPTLVLWVPGRNEVARIARAANRDMLRDLVTPWVAPASPQGA